MQLTGPSEASGTPDQDVKYGETSQGSLANDEDVAGTASAIGQTEVYIRKWNSNDYIQELNDRLKEPVWCGRAQWEFLKRPRTR